MSKEPDIFIANRIDFLHAIDAQTGPFTPDDLWEKHKKNPTVIKRGTPAIGRELTADGLVTDLSQQPNSGIVHAGPAGTFKVER